MPVYTYRCENCGHQFDKHQNFADEPLKVCPNCRKHMLHKVYHPAGVSFKGSGYYVTDKRNSASAASKPKKGKDNGASETKTEGKAETKGEAKSDSGGEAKSEISKPASKEK